MPDSAEQSKPAVDLVMAGEEKMKSMQSCHAFRNRRANW